MSKVIYIIRGLPGAGKSTIAKRLAPIYFSADDYFVNPTTCEYEFDINKLPEAHKWCYDNAERLMHCGFEIAVANTFTQKWEYEKYVKLAKKYGYEPIIITVSSNFKSIHKVPEETIQKMRDRFEYDPTEVLTMWSPVCDVFEEDYVDEENE